MNETDVTPRASGAAPEFRNQWLEGPFAPVDDRLVGGPIGFHGNWIPDAELEEQRKVVVL